MPPQPIWNGCPEVASSSCLRCREGTYSLINRGKTDENQDTSFVKRSHGGSKTLMGVLDGHGVNGKKVSEFASQQIAKNFHAHDHDLVRKHPVRALESAFLDTQSQIADSTSINASVSGTTAVVAYRRRNHLVVANVGDSRAVLGRLSKLASVASAGPRAIELTSDQRPARQDERRRVLAEGAVVHPGVELVETQQEMRLKTVGPQRVWDKTGRHGLSVTRSLGDLLMRPFVIAKPEFTTRTLDPDDRLLVLASDGVWDVLSSQEAVDIAARHTSPHKAAREIGDVAESRWLAQTKGHIVDDITAMVVYLEFGPLPSALDPSPPSNQTPRCVSRPTSARPPSSRPAPATPRAPATPHRALSSETRGPTWRLVTTGKPFAGA